MEDRSRLLHTRCRRRSLMVRSASFPSLRVSREKSMLQHDKYRKQGFTLIELAIVLTIAGLLFVGLWRLLAGGNAQIRDQSVGNEQQQIISAVKAYLGSGQAATDGFLTGLRKAGT